MNQTPQADFRADVRIQIISDPEEKTTEVVAVATNVLFRLPPSPGDRFLPGQLSPALLHAELHPVVKYIEHAPGHLPFHKKPEGGYANVVIYCTSRKIPSDTFVNELTAEGWAVSDWREQNARRRGL